MNVVIFIMTHTHHHSFILNAFTGLKILCALPTHPIPLPNLWQSLIFLLSSSFFPFTECYIVGIMQYVVFSDCFLSLSKVELQISHAFLWLDNSFFFSVAKYSIVWIYHNLFIHLLKHILVACKFCKL